jgi:peptidoglycan endopeptidase LytE
MLKRTLLCVGLVIICLSLSFNDARADVRYKVKPGDTLSKIARKYGIKPQDIRDANRMHGSALSRNRILIIPQKKSAQKSTRNEQVSKRSDKKAKQPCSETEIYRVKKGDTLLGVAAMADCSVETIRKMNRLRSNTLKVGRKLIIPKKAPVHPGEGDPDEEFSAETAGVAADEPEANSNPAIGKWSSPHERNLFVRVVKTFLGVPYRYGGTSLKGLDCSAFVKRVYEIVDVSLPRTAREQSQAGKWIKRADLQDGDLVFFRTRRVNDHVGIYIGNNQFVHLSSKNKEAKINHLDEPYFQKRFVRGVRVKELKPDSAPGRQAALES